MIDQKKQKKNLRFLFVFLVAMILLVSIAIVVTLEYIIIQTKLFQKQQLEESGLMWIILFGVSSLIIGFILALVFSKFFLRPIYELVDGMRKLSNGEFSTRLDCDKKDYLGGARVEFNALATQLQDTEMLSSDFVNNFSHELKTPIVSISGLMNLLKNENLSVDKKKRYLEIIEEEVNRLTVMTTNVLNLSKVEKQEIVKDKVKFNLSEQIRTCVLLLENKWTKKNVSFEMEFDEYFITASEDLFKQVWLNLLDNAVKFSNNDGVVEIKINNYSDRLSVSITNGGQTVESEELPQLFNKFYKGKNYISGESNGIGLSIVKRIIDLHGGKISAYLDQDKTTFLVEIFK